MTSGTRGQVETDPATGSGDNIYFQDTLGPGTYTLAPAVFDNGAVDTSAVDTSAGDSLIQDGRPGFTCHEAGASGERFGSQ